MVAGSAGRDVSRLSQQVTYRAWAASRHIERGDVLRARLVLTAPADFLLPYEIAFALTYQAGRADALDRLQPDN